METANDYRMGKGASYSFQVAGAEIGKTLNIQLQDALGNPFECGNFNTNAGDVQLSLTPSQSCENGVSRIQYYFSKNFNL